MKLSDWVLILLGWCMALPIQAQDALPRPAVIHTAMQPVDTLMLMNQRTDTLPVPVVHFPASFKNTRFNEITDSLGLLRPFWEKLRNLRHAASVRQASDTGALDTLRIVHVGDSHIRGRMFPRAAGDEMQRTFEGLAYTDYGINGAFCISFAREDRICRIAAMKPDMLILSLGTNEAHNRRYLPSVHYQQMDELVRMLQKALPRVPILVTTPPGQYDRIRIRRRRYNYKVNSRTASAAHTICRYADANGLAVWNLFEISGGATGAALNWQEAGLMRPDHIHYLPEGYDLQGKLLYQALIRAYNDSLEER